MGVTHPLKVSMSDIKIVHMRESICDIHQLSLSQPGVTQIQGYTNKFDAVRIWMCSSKTHDTSVVHPYGNHR